MTKEEFVALEMYVEARLRAAGELTRGPAAEKYHRERWARVSGSVLTAWLRRARVAIAAISVYEASQ